MSEPADFRPVAVAQFAPAALGAATGQRLPTMTRRYRLETGTPVIHAAPDGSPARARLIVMPSLRGHHAMFAELCTLLAEQHGYEVISPELFPEGQQWSDSERIAACVTLDDERVLRDMALAATHLQPGPQVIMGFCLGGLFACKAAARLSPVGVVSFYGFVRLPAEWRRADREEPLEAIRKSSAPVLGIFGSKDPLIPPADVAALEAVSHAEVMRFEAAGHAFAHDPLLPSYRAEDARVAWRAACAFIDRVAEVTTNRGSPA
jgi:carboxymethylenebutenolidase